MSTLPADVSPTPQWMHLDENALRPDGTYRTLLRHAEHPVVAIIGSRAIVEFESGRGSATIEAIDDRGMVTLRVDMDSVR